jgi:hypothetical protein
VSTDAQATSSRESPLRDPRPAGLPSDRLLDELLARLCGGMRADIAQFRLIDDDQLRVLAVSSDSDAEGGRGLFLVDQVATDWGSAVDDNTKTVWFELRV